MLLLIALCDEILTMSLYLTKLYVTQSFAIASTVTYSEIQQNFLNSVISFVLTVSRDFKARTNDNFSALLSAAAAQTKAAPTGPDTQGSLYFGISPRLHRMQQYSLSMTSVIFFSHPSKDWVKCVALLALPPAPPRQIFQAVPTRLLRRRATFLSMRHGILTHKETESDVAKDIESVSSHFLPSTCFLCQMFALKWREVVPHFLSAPRLCAHILALALRHLFCACKLFGAVSCSFLYSR